MATRKADVVIVGVGAAGAILAAELSRAGMTVVGLERGPRLKTADFEPQDELRYFQRQDLRPYVKRMPVTWRTKSDAVAHPLNVLNYGAQAGGGTVHYGSLSWRMHQDDFRPRSATVERYGVRAIPEVSSLVDWPVGYAELEPFYDRAEYDLGVGPCGQSRRHDHEGRKSVRGAAEARLSGSAADPRPGRDTLRRSGSQTGLQILSFAARDPLGAL